MTSPRDNDGSAPDRQIELAVNRTILAAERTYAAWMRTGLTALASGVGARALLASVAPDWTAVLAGVVLCAFSAFCFVAAVWRELHPSFRATQPEPRRLPAWLLIAVNGALVVVALTALVGVIALV